MKTFLTTTLSLLLAATLSQAQTFSLSANITADSDVLNSNTTAFAFDYTNMRGGGTTLVNGVSFSGLTTQGSISYAVTNFPSAANNGITKTAGMSTNYASILNDNVFQNNNSVSSFTLSGLTTGHTYELQLFDGSVFVSGTTKISDGSASGVLAYGPATSPSGGDFIVDTFVAGPSHSETLSFTPLTGNIGQFSIINAIDLRDLGAVPEPSTWALMLAGLLGIAFLGRRRLRVG